MDRANARKRHNVIARSPKDDAAISQAEQHAGRMTQLSLSRRRRPFAILPRNFLLWICRAVDHNINPSPSRRRS